VIVMDGNYRPRNFGGDTARARAVFQRFWKLADIALPTFDDELALWGDATPRQTAARLTTLGVREMAIKLGADGVLIAGGGSERVVPCPTIVEPVDTTAAGDSFNAGYLATRQKGGDSIAAALAGHRLAGVVIQHRGAIVPQAATAGVV
jgi:2-dehydro-3-deoxygluconokinase